MDFGAAIVKGLMSGGFLFFFVWLLRKNQEIRRRKKEKEQQRKESKTSRFKSRTEYEAWRQGRLGKQLNRL